MPQQVVGDSPLTWGRKQRRFRFPCPRALGRRHKGAEFGNRKPSRSVQERAPVWPLRPGPAQHRDFYFHVCGVHVRPCAQGTQT